ncbi:MAG: helix-turn-helix domain-containing protein, partial [Desulfobacterales bacterium]
ERLFFVYSWPGNVRELEIVIERALILCQSYHIKILDLPKEFKENVYNTLHIEGIPASAKLDEVLTMIEKEMIIRALKLTNNVQSQAAELLGIGKSGLNWKLKKFKLNIGTK